MKLFENSERELQQNVQKNEPDTANQITPPAGVFLINPYTYWECIITRQFFRQECPYQN